MSIKNWKDVVDNSFHHPNNSALFNEYVGLKRPATNADSPLECLRLLLTDEILNETLSEKNVNILMENQH